MYDTARRRGGRIAAASLITLSLLSGCQEVEDAEADAQVGGAGGQLGGADAEVAEGGAGGQAGGAGGEAGGAGGQIGGAGGQVGGAGGQVGGAGGQIGGAGGGDTCPAPLSVRVDGEGPFDRGDVVPLIVEMPEGMDTLSYPDELGTITPAGGALNYIAGGVLEWPWWGGGVALEITASGPGTCVARGEVEIPIMGDVLIADGRTGAILAYGSDGRVLGRFAQAAERGIHDLIALPESVGGGFVISVRGSAEASPEVIRLDDEGRPVTRFTMTDFEGAPLYDNMYHYGPFHLAWDAGRQEVLGDNLPYGRIPRWDLNGDYLGEIALPEDGSDFNNRKESVGFAYDEQGQVIAGRTGRYTLWRLPPAGDPSVYLQVDYELFSMANGEGDTILVNYNWGNDSYYATYNSAGRSLDGPVELFNVYKRYMTGFRGGYLLADGRTSSFIRYMAGDLTFPSDTRWQELEGDTLDTGAGILWLDGLRP